MKKLYHEYFHIPENGKISDKVMLGRTVVAALCVILCLCAFSVSTYAYYYMTVVSSGNTVQAATFKVEVYLDGSDTPATAYASGIYTIPTGTHTVKLMKTGTAEKVYFLINNNGVETYTGYLSGEDSFTISVETTATLTLKWGKLPNGTPVEFIMEDDLQEELEPATPSDLEENPSFNNPAESDPPVNSNDSANPGNPVVPDTPTTDEGNAEGEGESAGGDEDTGSDQSTGEGENTGGEGGAADDAVTDEGNAAEENNTVSGDETTGTEAA